MSFRVPICNAEVLYLALSTSLWAAPFGKRPNAFMLFVSPDGNSECELDEELLHALPGVPRTPPFPLSPVTKSLIAGFP